MDGGSRFSLLGDLAFVNLSDVDTCICKYHQPTPNAPLKEWEFMENCEMKSEWKYVEHGHADLEQAIGIIADSKHWSLMANKPYVVNMYISCVFFYNYCYACCFRNQNITTNLRVFLLHERNT